MPNVSFGNQFSTLAKGKTFGFTTKNGISPGTNFGNKEANILHTDFKGNLQSDFGSNTKMVKDQLFWLNYMLQTREQSVQEEFVV